MMSETSIAISLLNDFIFCPASIYFHNLDAATDLVLYQSHYQLNGTAVHTAVDKNNYSDKKSVLQGITVYSEEYDLLGKIDVFDIDSGILTERKKHISHIYDGYIFQLYAQYFGLKEMGYKVKELRFYSYDTNQVFRVDLPEKSKEMFIKFKCLLKAIKEFSLEDFKQTNSSKCNNCIYEELCSFSVK